MQQEVYEICSKPLGQGKIAQVYKIKKMDIPHNILIAKIYQKKRIIYYEKEKKILLRISNENNNGQNDYLIHLKEANATLTPSDEFSEDSELLTFDFLIHGNIILPFNYSTLITIQASKKQFNLIKAQKMT